MLLLQIVKWIIMSILGILILSVLLLIFFTLLPIRYEIQGRVKEKNINLKGRTGWCFGLIYLSFLFSESKVFDFKVRIFGKLIYDSLGEKKKKKNRDHKKLKSKDKNEKKQEKINDNFDIRRDEEEKTGKIANGTAVKEDIPDSRPLLAEETKETGRKKEKAALLNKVHDFVIKIKEKISSFRKIKNDISYYYSLWNREETQIVFGKAKKASAKLVKAFLPKKWQISGKAGFKDPSVTGELVGFLSILYPYTKDRIKIIPFFEKEIMELDFFAKGKIRPFYLIYHFLLFITNKQVLHLIKIFKNSKENQEAAHGRE